MKPKFKLSKEGAAIARRIKKAIIERAKNEHAFFWEFQWNQKEFMENIEYSIEQFGYDEAEAITSATEKQISRFHSMLKTRLQECINELERLIAK